MSELRNTNKLHLMPQISLTYEGTLMLNRLQALSEDDIISLTSQWKNLVCILRRWIVMNLAIILTKCVNVGKLKW